MKYKYIILILFCISCNNRVQKNKIAKKTMLSNDSVKKDLQETISKEVLFLVSDSITKYDFNQEPLSKLSINDNLNFMIKENLKKEILKKKYYYNLIYYNEIKKTDSYKIFTIVGNYDYRTDIWLITTSNKKDSLVDSELIASVEGDGDYVTEMNSKKSGNIFVRKILSKELEGDNYVVKKVTKDSIKILNNGHFLKLPKN